MRPGYYLIPLIFILISCGSKQSELPVRQPDFFESETLGRSLGCSFSAVSYPTLVVKIGQQEMADLVAVVQSEKIRTIPEFWSLVPADISELFQNLLQKSYRRSRPNSDLRNQPIEYYLELLADGVIRLAEAGIRSDYVDFVRVTRPPNYRDIGAYGIRFYLDPHTFDLDHPIQVILFCPQG